MEPNKRICFVCLSDIPSHKTAFSITDTSYKVCMSCDTACSDARGYEECLQRFIKVRKEKKMSLLKV